MKKIFLILSLFIFLLIVLFCFVFYKNNKQVNEQTMVRQNDINNFKECLMAGNVIMESYPRQCRTSEGFLFVEDIGNELEKMDLIIVDYPRPQTTISSPLKVTGKARGYWYFEASFPIEIINSSGEIITQGIATAQSDWMTEEFVSFSAELEFTHQEKGSSGKIIFKKDNPSDLRENDDFLEIPIIFI